VEKAKILEVFYEIEMVKESCLINGEKIHYKNIYVILPIISYILEEIGRKNYERKCVSEIYM
jgi:hypothetical protein